MRTTPKECEHCGIEYYYYLSGGYIPVYSSDTYCEGCEKIRYNAVNEAFKTVPVLFAYQYILTDDYTLDELLKIEKENREHDEKEWQKRIDAGEFLFPLARRVYSTLMDTKTGETSRYSLVRHNGETYSYMYWPSKPEEAEIRIFKRIDMTTGEPVGEFKTTRDD